jgi:hypothetical protein
MILFFEQGIMQIKHKMNYKYKGHTLSNGTL